MGRLSPITEADVVQLHGANGPGLDEVGLAAWIAQAEPGEALVYHRGFLAVDATSVSFGDKVGQEPKPMRVLPSPQDISRMEETLTWTACLEPLDGKIVWMKAHGERWKEICWAVGLRRSAARQHWQYGLSVIALTLNRRSFNTPLRASLSKSPFLPPMPLCINDLCDGLSRYNHSGQRPENAWRWRVRGCTAHVPSFVESRRAAPLASSA